MSQIYTFTIMFDIFFIPMWLEFLGGMRYRPIGADFTVVASFLIGWI